MRSGFINLLGKRRVALYAPVSPLDLNQCIAGQHLPWKEGPVMQSGGSISKKEETMPTQESSADFFLNWAKERIDEMDAALISLNSKAAELRAGSRAKADQFIADLREKRDEFESAVKKE